MKSWLVSLSVKVNRENFSELLFDCIFFIGKKLNIKV